eukprot:5235985-Amphidinium_carterae.1
MPFEWGGTGWGGATPGFLPIPRCIIQTEGGKEHLRRTHKDDGSHPESCLGTLTVLIVLS